MIADELMMRKKLGIHKLSDWQLEKLSTAQTVKDKRMIGVQSYAILDNPSYVHIFQAHSSEVGVLTSEELW